MSSDIHMYPAAGCELCLSFEYLTRNATVICVCACVCVCEGVSFSKHMSHFSADRKAISNTATTGTH